MASEAYTLFPNFRLAEDDLTTGLLPYQNLVRAVELGYIRAARPVTDDQVQPSSVDLRLGPIAYQVAASFLPGSSSTMISKLRDLTIREIDLSSCQTLKKGNIYIVPLMEELNLPGFLRGKANPKSTTGRLDVFTRLVCDYCQEFDDVALGFRGKLFAEIVPRTFDVIVEQGSRLNQLRLIKGKPTPSDSRLIALHHDEGLVYSDGEILRPMISKKSLWLSLDLNGLDGSRIVGYKALRNAPPIKFSRVNYYDPTEYWEAIRRPEKGSIVLQAEEFYILASKERVRIPADHAAEMVPFDASVGEFRIHYAGFFDPGFGCREDDLRGTHAVLEVRSHGVPFLVDDGQRIGRLIFEQMLSEPSKLYGGQIGSSYQAQGLALSKQFKTWNKDND